MAGPFDTPLTPEEETRFQIWKQLNAPNDSGADYDLRGAFKANLSPGANGHRSDLFKKPNHPTFSDESQYAKDSPELAGHWEGDKYVPPTAAAGPSFASLVEHFGLSAALNLMRIFSLFDPNASALNKATGAASVAGNAAQLGGKLGGSAGLSGLGQGLGTAAGLAGAGMGIYDAATDPNLSTKQKAGHAGNIAGETALSIYGGPYTGLGVLARHINGMLERSRSPQVSGVGKGLGFLARPVEGFLNVAAGDMSPRAAGNQMVAQARDTPVLGKAISPIFDLLGLGTKPTTGTMFRNEVGSIFDRIPQLKGTPTGAYNIDPNAYNALPQAVRDQATKLSQQLAPLAPHSASNPQAYQNQLAAILLNRFGAAGLPNLNL